MSFSISCKAGLVVMKSLSFYSSGKVFIYPSFFKDSLARYSTLRWQYSFFSILNMSYLFLLACTVSVEKSVDSIIGAHCGGTPLYVTNCFLFVVFKILSLSLTFDNLIVMCLSVTLFELQPIWCALGLMNLGVPLSP